MSNAALKLTETERERAKPKRFAFTIDRLAAIKPPAKGYASVYDTKTPGLTLLTTAGGVKTYYVYAKPKGKARPVRVRLGRFEAIQLDDARKLARKELTKTADGRNPVEEYRLAREAETFGQAFTTFIKIHKSRTAKSVEKDEQRYRKYLIGWANHPLRDITRADVEKVRNEVQAKTSGTTANRVLSLISVIYNVITNRDYNPARGVQRLKEIPRCRFLSQTEVASLLAALTTIMPDIADVIRLALFTGCRRWNILSARWEELNLTDAAWHIPGEKMKSAHPLTVALQPQALEVFKRRKEWNDAKAEADRSPFVFPSHSATGHTTDISTSWETVMDAAGISGVRFHDLRRTFCSFMAMSGASLTVAQKTLGHLSPLTTSRVYSQADEAAKRQAGAAALAMMTGAPAKSND